MVGVTVFLVLLLFAVQVVLNLYAASAVTGVAFDAARVVAGADGGDTAAGAAEAQARAVLAAFEANGGRLELTWDLSSPEVVRLTVRATRPPLLANVPFPFERVERTVTVRRERVQVAP